MNRIRSFVIGTEFDRSSSVRFVIMIVFIDFSIISLKFCVHYKRKLDLARETMKIENSANFIIDLI